MPNATDPAAPPAYVLNTLHAAEYEPYAVDDGPTMWRLHGQAPKTWKQCMEDIGLENAKLRSEAITARNDAMVARDQAAQLKDQIQRMQEVDSHPWWKPTKELLLTVGTVLPMGAVTVFSVIGENANTLLAPPYGHVIGVLATALAGKIIKDYVGSDAKKTVAALEEKRAIAQENK